MHSVTRVAIINDYEVVVRGLWHMIGDVTGLQIVELDSMVDPVQDVDIALFDTFAAEQGIGVDLRRLLERPNIGKVVVYTWNLDPALIHEAEEAGVAGYLSKRLSADELIDALTRIRAGERVFSAPEPEGVDETTAAEWPGKHQSLTAREAEVMGLIVQGHTNEEIAQRLYLSINSVKTFIRSAYRRVGVTRRSEAILWGIDHGFLPRRTSTRLDAGSSPAVTAR